LATVDRWINQTQRKHRTHVAEGSSPAAMTEFSAGHVTAVVTEAVVAWSTEFDAARTVQVGVTDGAVAVHDSGQQR